MNERQEEILKAVVQHYIETADPVGSSVLAETFDVSPATVRNEMATLEDEDYIFQPHTSAGRVPTNKGFHYYIESLRQASLRSHLKLLRELYDFHASQEKQLNQAVRLLSRLSGNAAIGYLPQREITHFGLSNILSQPEFRDNYEQIIPLAETFDQLDGFIETIMNQCQNHLNIFLGDEIPIKNSNLGLMMQKFETDRGEGAIGILGPNRMPYIKLLPILKQVAEILEEAY